MSAACSIHPYSPRLKMLHGNLTSHQQPLRNAQCMCGLRCDTIVTLSCLAEHIPALLRASEKAEHMLSRCWGGQARQ